MKACVHGYPRHYRREAHLNIGAVRSNTLLHHLCLPEMLQPSVHQPNPISPTNCGPSEEKTGEDPNARASIKVQWNPPGARALYPTSRDPPPNIAAREAWRHKRVACVESCTGDGQRPRTAYKAENRV
jgi:hypothetical protein